MIVGILIVGILIPTPSLTVTLLWQLLISQQPVEKHDSPNLLPRRLILGPPLLILDLQLSQTINENQQLWTTILRSRNRPETSGEFSFAAVYVVLEHAQQDCSAQKVHLLCLQKKLSMDGYSTVHSSGAKSVGTDKVGMGMVLKTSCTHLMHCAWIWWARK